jgi:hypothetical protein
MIMHIIPEKSTDRKRIFDFNLFLCYKLLPDVELNFIKKTGHDSSMLIKGEIRQR